MSNLSKKVFKSKHEPEDLKVLILGAVHGNEVAGPIAIDEIHTEFESDLHTLTRGTVTFISPVNRKAFEEGRRFIDLDLNRVLKKKENPSVHEEYLANELIEEIASHDVLLDLHSTQAPGPVSVFIDFPTEENKRLANALGAQYALFDWPRVYESNKYAFESFDTTRCAFELGKAGVLLECGQHADPQSIFVAKQGILRTLSHLNMISTEKSSFPSPTKIFMCSLESKLDDMDEFTQRWAHLEHIPKGTVLFVRKDGTSFITDRDYRILFPKYNAKKGDEWFYLGIEAK